jgi:hypothetical protein
LKRIAILVAVLLLVMSAATMAQTKTGRGTMPDWQLSPTYGSVELSSGFAPDPYRTYLTAGGNINLNVLGYNGFVAEAPDVDFYYEAGGFPLYIYVEEQDTDCVLLINGPSGQWYFNDDAVGNSTRPGIEFSSPESGLYSIWVGTYWDDLADATLAISELGWAGPGPDWSLEPTYGSLDLAAGFSNDPRTVNVLAGGNVDLSSLGYYGNVAEAPDLDLYYDAGPFSLYIYVSQADADTVLLVNDPSGNWHYNDDYMGLRAGIEFSFPESGLYNIWVGTWGGSMVDATIAISEINPEDNMPGPDFSLSPNYGTVDLVSGFKAPYRVNVLAGGIASGRTVDRSGWYSEAPDLSLFYESSGRPLYIWLDRDSGDTTILVNDPNGQWLYNDDANGLGLGSGLVINNPVSGRYDIWAGTLGEGNLYDAAIVISETSW